MPVDAPRDPQTVRRDRQVSFSVAGLVAATVLIGALAPGAPKQVALAPADDPACAEWGNGCRICRRTESGPACSLPGIACTPGAMACLRGAGEP